jgi:hypothetical protein
MNQFYKKQKIKPEKRYNQMNQPYELKPVKHQQ